MNEFTRQPSNALRVFGDMSNVATDRDVMLAYSKGYIDESKLSSMQKKKIEMAYEISEILLAHRTERKEAILIIKEKYGFKTREETNRAIEDAEYYIGTTFHVNKTWQMSMVMHDIEVGLQESFIDRDWKSHNKYIEMKIKLLGLDKPQEEQLSYFDRKEFIIDFNPKIFNERLGIPEDYKEQYSIMIAKTLKKAGIEITDADYEEL